MNTGFVLTEKIDAALHEKAEPILHEPPSRPAVLIATIDPEIREGLAELVERAGVSAIWVSAVKDLKTVVAKDRVVACFCGFWLQDGTYREVVRHLRRERKDIPAIIVSGPACPQEYRDYLTAVNFGALDYLSHPYDRSDFQRMLESAIEARSHSTARKGSLTGLNHPSRVVAYEY
jgi:DNA-binding NtrC family response regulator